ncbi:3-deoxy-7-phosphoheptulonate synthase [Treponema brennaborense]|uniref:Phospho-2-dehydro-3-deoxyheptonate aldolase n=1 Tax=Treponema brennaborense (strain DSM 12168 / CIP 105900 / DD5/3) TaxID=906968 RepID=F4LIV3_TREBD|nr:3-deoxy-7-phosphoheptulonate synthase [Treponema brennaborense]AEE16278.1 phospho-2-dehydro-3-deoxyheptonate aldolase [Treponema brennaborense DSM 12168]
MIVVLKPDAAKADIDLFVANLKRQGVGVHISHGTDHTIVGLIGDTSRMTPESFKANHIVDTVMRVQAPYKMANRAFHPENTAVTVAADQIGVASAAIGDGNVAVIAGPCSVESEEQLTDIAECVKASGARFLRGGAFKPRTSPYSFQGLGCEGIELLLAAKKTTGLPIVTELMSITQLELFDGVDVIQIGARNMQNFDLLKELGSCKKPILLKRGLANTVKELLMSAEYIMAAGNENVILCERGIRSFDQYTRNTLDLSAVPFLKKESHLPVVVDPSHACGISWMVPTLAKAAVAAGADGIMVEVHNNPECALCDGEQSLTPVQFDDLMKKLAQYAAIEGRTL